MTLVHVELYEYSPQALHFYDIFNESLQPVSRMSIDEAATRLLQFLPQKDTGAEIVSELFLMIREIAQDIPYSHPSSLKLARITRGVLHSSRFVDPSFRKDAEIYRYQHFHEVIHPIFENMRDGDDVLDAQGFLAHFYNETFPDRPDFSIFLLQDAFEEDEQPVVEAREILAKSAAVWILIYGGNLFRIVCDQARDDEDWHPRERYKSRLQGKGERHLTLQRWRFWIESFEEIASGTLTVGNGAQASEKCKTLCRTASNLMQGLAKSRDEGSLDI